MLMTRSNFIGPIPSVSIGGSLITQVERSRLLGVTVDNKLTWSPHLLEVKKSFANKLNLLKKSRFLPRSVLEKFYLSVILPSVTYCMLTWASCSNSELFGSLESLHSRAARIIYDLKDTSNEDSLKIAKWQTLAYIYKDKLFKLIHNAYNDLLPKQLCTSIINKRMSNYALRGSDNIVVPRITSRYLEQSISYRGAVLWNAITSKNSDIVSASRRTISSRLRKIKDFTEFHFKVLSASTVNFSNQDFKYFQVFMRLKLQLCITYNYQLKV